MQNKVAIRDAYGHALVKVGRENSQIVALEADVGSSSKSILFGKEFPDRYFNVGIAELNMVAMAAGFAASGYTPFVNTFAVFMTTRGCDPISSMIAYDNLNVKLAGTYSGLSDSYDGASHHALSDISFVRSLPNMTIISVSDAVQTQKAVEAAVQLQGPVYLRLSRAEVPVLYTQDSDFTVGKGIVLSEGNDVSIIATGYMVHKALEAAKQLEKEGICARVVDMHTIKPIDRELIIRCAAQTGAIVTVEEHSIYGGLGSAVAEAVVAEYPVPVYTIGLDSFTESGDYEALLQKYKLSPENIAQKCKLVLSKKIDKNRKEVQK